MKIRDPLALDSPPRSIIRHIFSAFYSGGYWRVLSLLDFSADHSTTTTNTVAVVVVGQTSEARRFEPFQQFAPESIQAGLLATTLIGRTSLALHYTTLRYIVFKTRVLHDIALP